MYTKKAQKSDLQLMPFSTKQNMLFSWWLVDPNYDGIITDGSARAGKTIVGAVSYILWAMFNFNFTNFGIAGKSLSTLKRNLWIPLQQFLDDIGVQRIRLKDTENGYIFQYSFHTTSGELVMRENYFYLFGGKDAGSAAFIQGLTAGGFFFDEVALMPESFVDQAVARCSVENSKVWFNCNPDSPYHWFKVRWIDQKDKKRLLRIRFKMEDNPSLSEKTLDRYKRQWEGVFYQRFILGEWVVAEGSIYKVFADYEQEFYVKFEREMRRKRQGIYVNGEFCPFMVINIGIDWGGKDSNHAFVATGITHGYKHLVALGSKKFKAKDTTPDQVIDWAITFFDQIRNEYGEISSIYVDSSEQILKNLLSTKTDIPVRNSLKKKIVDRIRFTVQLMAERRLLIIKRRCKTLIEYFQAAVYDDNSKTDKRLDDGSYDQDTGDAFEYSFERYMGYMIYEFEKYGER